MITDRCPPPNWFDDELDELRGTFSVPLADRVNYLSIVGSTARLDERSAPKGLERLLELCLEFGLSEYDTRHVLTSAYRPKPGETPRLDELCKSPLRFTLLSDCIAVARADGEYALSERRKVRELARALELDELELRALEERVLGVELLQRVSEPRRRRL
ncbi:MAG TPA: TerB family tellurite resistance protein [Polyangiaceae bacterium]|jgi:hypothetical protein